MKFRIAFAVSKTERKFILRLWDWDIWHSDSDIEEESIKRDLNKAGFVSFKKKNEEPDEEANYDKLLFQALFHPEVECKIWRVCKKLFNRILNLFSVKFENIEIKGTLDDPFYDAIALGVSGGCYYPNWEDENGDWSAKGEIILKTGLFRFSFFVLTLIYELITLSFVLWRGTRLAEKNPNGENMDDIRRWIFLKCRS